MGIDLINYIDRLILIAFFSGYPLIYALVHVITAEKRKKHTGFANRLVSLLPYAYALSGTLFLGLVLKDMSPHFSFKNIAEQFQAPYLKAWGLTAILFWIPALSKKRIISLIHSLIFFFLVLKDLFMYMIASPESELIHNDMKLYTISLLIISASFLFVVFLDLILKATNRKKVLPG